MVKILRTWRGSRSVIKNHHRCRGNMSSLLSWWIFLYFYFVIFSVAVLRSRSRSESGLFLAEAGLSFFLLFDSPESFWDEFFEVNSQIYIFWLEGFQKPGSRASQKGPGSATLLMQQSPVNYQICKKKLALKNNDKNPTLMMSCCLTCTVVHIWKVFNFTLFDYFLMNRKLFFIGIILSIFSNEF